MVRNGMPEVTVKIHPVHLAFVLRRLAEVETTVRAYVAEQVNSGEWRPSEAAATLSDHDLAAKPLKEAATAAIRKNPSWAHWFEGMNLTVD